MLTVRNLNFYTSTKDIYILDIFVILYESKWNKFYDLFSILYNDIKYFDMTHRYHLPEQIRDYLTYKNFSFIDIEHFL